MVMQTFWLLDLLAELRLMVHEKLHGGSWSESKFSSILTRVTVTTKYIVHEHHVRRHNSPKAKMHPEIILITKSVPVAYVVSLTTKRA
jgi:hypothetical protein